MATAIEIIRRSEISWVIIPDGVAANETQEAWWRGTRIGDSITFKSTNGAVEFKDINYQYISYTDEVTPANDIASFTSGYECYNYLKEQGFFEVGSGSGSVATTFKSLTDTFSSFLGRGLQVLRVNEAMTAIESFILNAASKLSELTDGPGAYSNGKYLKSTSDGWVWSDGFNVNQNNIGRKKFLGITPSSPTTSQVAALMNETTTVISEIQTPIIVYTHDVFLSSFTNPSKMYPYLFLPGEGTYGIGGTTVTQSMLFRLQEVNLTPEDIENDPNAVIINIDPVVDGDYITKANESFWDFSDSDYENGTKSYYFSYTFEGDLYYALFVGEPGTYGDGGDSLFTEDDFVDTTNSGVQPEIPEGIEMWVEGEYSENQSVYKIINSQLYLFRSTADGNTTEPLLNSNIPAWSGVVYGLTSIDATYVGEWSAGSYLVGDVVSKGVETYCCLTANSTDPELLIAPNWFKIGAWKGLFSALDTYQTQDVVRDSDNNVYISNFRYNQYPLNTGIVSKWEVVNGMPLTVVIWGNSISQGVGAGATENYTYPKRIEITSGINVDINAVAGATVTEIEADFLANPEKWVFPTIFQVVENNRFEPTLVIDTIANMVSKLPHDRYLVIGSLVATTDGTVDVQGLNDDLRAIYGKRFIDVNTMLDNIYNDPSGFISPVLRSDWLHLNDKGYAEMAKIILSKKQILLGSDDGFYSSLVVEGLNITGSNLSLDNLKGGAIFSDASTGKLYILAVDENDGSAKDISIGFTVNGKIYLNENGGQLFSKINTVYTSGASRRLIVDSTTNEIKLAPVIGAGIIPYENTDGVLQASEIRQVSDEVVVNTLNADIVDGFKLQVNGGLIAGAKGGKPRLRLYNTADTAIILSIDDSDSSAPLSLFGSKVLIGYLTTATSEALQVNGKALVSDAPTSPTGVVRLTDLSGYATLATAQTITGIKDFPNSITIPDGLASNNPASIGQLNTTNATVAALAARSLVVTGVTDMQTSASLNSAHPSAGVPTYVAYPDTSGSPMIYQKVTTTQWIGYAGVLV